MDISNRTRNKLFVVTILGVAMLGALVWNASPGTIWATLKGGDFRLVLLAWAVSISATMVRTARFSMFVPIHGKVARTYAVFSLSRIINMALPFRIGDLAMLAVLKRAQIAPTIAHLLPVWLVLRFADALALALWFCGAVVISTLGREYLPAGIVLIVVATCALFFFQHLLALVPAHVFENTKNRFIGRLAAVVEGMRATQGVQKRILAGLGGIVIWGLLVVSATLVQMAFDSPLDTHHALLAAVFAASFSVIPINTPLAVGTGEVFWTAAMMLVGLSLEAAIPLAISLRLSSLSIMIIEGALGAGILVSVPATTITEGRDTGATDSCEAQGASSE